MTGENCDHFTMAVSIPLRKRPYVINLASVLPLYTMPLTLSRIFRQIYNSL